MTKIFPPRGGAGEVTAVNGVDLEIQQGELVTLLGPSGCGKTTTLRMIAGFEFPTSGRILLDGKEINTLPPNKRDMSMVFQSYAIFPHLNVFENIAYGLNVQHLHRREIERRVDRVMELVELTGYGTARPQPAFRRAAAAGGPGARPGDGAQGAADGRAALQPGRQAARSRCAPRSGASSSSWASPACT